MHWFQGYSEARGHVHHKDVTNLLPAKGSEVCIKVFGTQIVLLVSVASQVVVTCKVAWNQGTQRHCAR